MFILSPLFCEMSLFECAIAGLIEDAVFEDEILAITKGLRTGDATTNKTKVAGVPTEVFAFDIGIIDRTVLGFPKGVFGIEDSVVNLYVAGVLEDVSTLQLDIGDLKLVGMHKGIRSVLYAEVGDLTIPAVPESLFAVRNTKAFEG